MGRISDEDVRRVRDATDLVSLVQERVVLKQKGRLFWGCCPFHQEKTPSFKVDPATQLWHCFGCGLGGDAYGWVMRTESVDFGEAVRSLADRAHIEIVETAGGVPPAVVTAKWLVTAWPMPRVAPVTIATRPVRSNIDCIRKGHRPRPTPSFRPSRTP